MFCPNCGNRINENARYCTSCGAAVHTAIPIASTPESGSARAANPNVSGKAPLKNKLIDPLLIPVAVILILMGIGHMALAVVGSTVTAQVTGYEQMLFVHNDESTRNPSRYKLEYAFSVNGERYTGSVTRVFPGGSHMRQTLPVRYLPFWPHVNAEDGETAGLAGPVMTGLGVFLLVLEVKRKFRL